MHVSKKKKNIFPPRTEELGDWRKLHDEELSFVLPTKYYPGDEIMNNEMIEASGK